MRYILYKVSIFTIILSLVFTLVSCENTDDDILDNNDFHTEITTLQSNIKVEDVTLQRSAMNTRDITTWIYYLTIDNTKYLVYNPYGLNLNSLFGGETFTEVQFNAIVNIIQLATTYGNETTTEKRVEILTAEKVM